MMRKGLTLTILILLVLGLAVPAQAQCGVFKTWTTNEILASADLNSAFTRTVDANTPACVDDYSASVSQMRTTTDPYPSSAESLATTLAGELERLRYQLKALVGKTYWYEVVDNSLAKSVSKHWGATFTKYSEIADPAAPGSNELALYAKDDGGGVTVLAYRDSAGTVNTLTGASTSFGSSVTVNLRIIRNAATPTTKLDVTADRISIAGYIKSSYSVTIDASTTGANALDTGAIAANTAYYVWAIVKPSTATFAGLVSISESAPTMPSGYTQKRLIGMFRTATGAATFLDGIQKQDTFMYAAGITLVSASAATTATAIDLTGYVPGGSVSAALMNAECTVACTGALGFSPFAFAGTFTGALAADTVMITQGSGAGAVAAKVSLWVPTLNATPTTIYFGHDTTIGSTSNILIMGWRIAWKD